MFNESWQRVKDQKLGRGFHPMVREVNRTFGELMELNKKERNIRI